MKRKVLRYFWWVMAVTLGLPSVVVFLLYLPPVQGFVKGVAERYVADHYGVEISVGRFRLGFPLDLRLEKVYVGREEGDTLASLDRLRVRVGLGGLWRKQVSVGRFELEGVRMAWGDGGTGMKLDVDVERMDARVPEVNWGERRVKVGSVRVEGGRVWMEGENGTEEDTEKKEMEGEGWRIGVERVELVRMAYGMRTPSMPELRAGLGEAWVAGGEVGIGGQTVGVDSVWVSGGWCRMAGGGSEEKMMKEEEGTGMPWTVLVGKVGLENGDFRMGEGKEKLVLSGIGVQVEEVYNRGTVVRARLRDVHAVREGGPVLAGMEGSVVLDSTETAFRGGVLHTRHSHLRLEVDADAGFEDIPGREPLQVAVSGEIGMEDVGVFYSGLPEELRGERLSVGISALWSGEDLKVGQLLLEMPGHLKVTGSGNVSGWRERERMRGEMEVRGELEDVSFAGVWLEGMRVELPRGMELSAKVWMEEGEYRGDVRFCCSEGCLALDGFYRPGTEVYDGELLVSRFPLYRFLPEDSLGHVSAGVRFTGQGFSPETMRAEVNAEVHELEYGGYAYRDVSLAASLRRMRLRGTLVSEDEAVPVGLVFKGDSVDGVYALSVQGHVGMVDLQRLHFVPEPLRVEAGIRLEAMLDAERSGSMMVELDSVWMADGRRSDELGNLKMELATDSLHTRLELHSGDLRMEFRADTSLTEFISGMRTVAEVIGRQVKERVSDMEEVGRAVPPFSLEIAGDEQNAVAHFLKVRDMGFKHLFLSVVSRRRSGLRAGMSLQGGYVGTVRVDSMQAGVWQVGKSLVYSLRGHGGGEMWKGFSDVGVNGRIERGGIRMELKQRDAEGRVGFDLGVDAEMRDSVFMIGLFPVNPVLGYNRWKVNEGNWVTVDKRGRVRANLRMENGDKRVNLQSLPDDGEQRERLRMELVGVDLAEVSGMVPMMPDLGGRLDADMMMYDTRGQIGVEGSVAVEDMEVNGKRVGSPAVDLQYLVDQRFKRHEIGVGVSMDGVRQMEAKGEVGTDGKEGVLSLDVDIPSLSLDVANAFLPLDLMQLKGILTGGVRLRGTLNAPQIDGKLVFREGKADMVMLGSVFGLDTVPVWIKEGRILFDAFRFMAPNRSELVLDGAIRLTPFERMGMELAVDARNFEVVNVRKNPTSMIYGKAYADVHAEMSGLFSELDITGKVHLLNTTDITYVLRSSATALVDKSVDLVRFVSFSDTTGQEMQPFGKVNAGGVSMRMQIEIGESVHAGVDLSEDGGNRVDIRGGGNLVLAMSPENGMSLSGKYILSDGTVEYGVPVVGKKEFRISSGSFVEWTGMAMNPTLNISAAEQVKADVEEGEQARQVLFESIIRIRNNLAHPDITFDLSAPNDMVIQNQLATFSPEERTRQALNLLIYNTYTAPGSVSSGVNVANNALYSLVENELNKYTRKAGLTVGFDAHGTDDNVTRTDVTYQFSRQLFNDRVRVKIGGRISTDGNEDGSGSLKNNLVDDISIEYTMTKKRNLFAKVFRHSNYESVLDGQVVRTGAGIVWRKNFRKFKDLFKNKNREERLNPNMRNP